MDKFLLNICTAVLQDLLITGMDIKSKFLILGIMLLGKLVFITAQFFLFADQNEKQCSKAG